MFGAQLNKPHVGLVIPVRDASGRIQAILVRTGDETGKYKWLSSPQVTSGTPCHVPLFGGDRSIVRITEGPLKADVAMSLDPQGIPTLGISGLTWEPAPDVVRELKPTEVRIAFDADQPPKPQVQRATQELAQALKPLGVRVLVETWDAARGKGIDDALLAGAEITAAEVEWAAGPEVPEEKGEKGGSRATQLVSLVLSAGAELFHDPEGRPYLAVPVGNHREVLTLETAAFRDWLTGLAFSETKMVPAKAAIEEAERTLIGMAKFQGPQRDVGLRLASSGGSTYLDLADLEWRAVEITPGGWQVVSTPAVYFRRAKGMLALPEPRRGGDLTALRDILNLGSERNWRLTVAYLLGCLMPRGPYPILILHGEQGSAKSTTARGLRYLLDPHATALRAAPKEERDLAISAHNNLVLAYDNLSDIRPWLSDALCRVATGSGFATRQLYTNEDEAQIAAARPVLLNGIAAEMANRPDLLDRAVVLELPVISDESRRTEQEVWGQLKQARPLLLGALLDAAATGLRTLPDLRPASLPRMADWARWVEACAPALGWKPGEFLADYTGLRAELDGHILGQWPVYPVLEKMLDEAEEFQGTVGRLRDRLNAVRQDHFGDLLPRDWPSTAKALGQQLKEHAPNLRRVGIVYEALGRGNKGFRCHVTRAPRAEVE
jgi:hypothetical protein